MPKFTAEQLIRRKIERRFNKALKDYAMLADGDHILVALSGGKDSLAMLEFLAAQSRKHKPNIKITAAHIRLRNIEYLSDSQTLETFCSDNGVEFHLVESEFDATGDKRKSPCFLCSWNRRKALFELAQELGCNKLALGHNMDDFLETLLMNITFQGAFSAMGPTMQMQKFPLTIIRPLCLANEADIETLSTLANYPQQIKRCPYERDSNREEMKRLLKKLEELNPEARYSLWGSMTNIQPELLPPPIR
jgi:tRNA(Ile)-lysidine synthase TilS/MesJ